MLYSNYPTIDLHGMDRDYARMMINQFIEENYKLKKYDVVIIHGIGSGILRQEVKKTLSVNKKVESFKNDFMNIGCTIVKIKQRN